MNNKSAFEKYNIIFIILLFVIPLFSLNVSFFYLSDKNKEWDLKDQDRKALQDAEYRAKVSEHEIKMAQLRQEFYGYRNNYSKWC